jgi:hypothetical protein
MVGTLLEPVIGNWRLVKPTSVTNFFREGRNMKKRFNYLFGSTKGLILVAIAMISIVTAVWGMLSGPMAEMGVREVVVKALGMDLVQAEREGRIIILYHSIAMGIIAIETYMVTGLLKMKEFFKLSVRVLITVGYILTMIFGMGFAYFGHNWAFHGLYITGLSLIFFAGVLLCVALWPWNPEYTITDRDYSHTRSGMDLERAAFFTTAVTTVISALFGAVPGSYYGHGFETFLAENIIDHRSFAYHAGFDRDHDNAHHRALAEFQRRMAQGRHAAHDPRLYRAQPWRVGRGHAA